VVFVRIHLAKIFANRLPRRAPPVLGSLRYYNVGLRSVTDVVGRNESGQKKKSARPHTGAQPLRDWNGREKAVPANAKPRVVRSGCF